MRVGTRKKTPFVLSMIRTGLDWFNDQRRERREEWGDVPLHHQCFPSWVRTMDSHAGWEPNRSPKIFDPAGSRTGSVDKVSH